MTIALVIASASAIEWAMALGMILRMIFSVMYRYIKNKLPFQKRIHSLLYKRLTLVSHELLKSRYLMMMVSRQVLVLYSEVEP